jgi:hypothetical protein
LAATAPMSVEAKVDGNASHPRIKQRRIPQLVNLAPTPQVGIVQDVFGLPFPDEP